MAEPLLQVKDLKTYFFTEDGVVRAVDGVTYDIQAGEIMGLVGESGCGKTVSALSILRLIPKPPGRIIAGEILFGGEDLLKADDEEIRDIRGHHIAMIFQEPMTSLNPVLTIGRQVTESLELHLKMNRSSATRRAIELLEMVGIPEAKHRIHDYPHQFSGGMRQRVMIAMALACRPKLLIADEPVTALDVMVQAQILALLRRLRDELGIGMILISHDLSVIAESCDRAVVMYAGRVAEAGTAEAIFGRPAHPYTRALIEAFPNVTGERTLVEGIPGYPPDLRTQFAGCPFEDRCPIRIPACATTEPPLHEVAAGHVAACLLAESRR